MKLKETKPKQWDAARRCLYCRLSFTPGRPQDANQQFCQPTHRNEYYRHGSMPFPKLVAALKKAVAAELAGELVKAFEAATETLVTKLVAAELRKQKALDAKERQAYADDANKIYDKTPDNQADSLHGPASPEREAGAETAETPANGSGDDFAATAVGGAEVRGNGGTGEAGGSVESVPVGRKKRAPRRERVFVSETYGAQVDE